MFNLKIGKKILATAKTYEEVRTKAWGLAKKYRGEEFVVDRKVITDTGIDLGWEFFGAIRCYL
jgi:hypothetical protein